MVYPVDLGLFKTKAHSPSYHDLQASMGVTDLKIIDYCIPVNSYFPTKAMMDKYASNLHEILKYYPDQNAQLSEIVARVFGYDPECLLLFNGSNELITYIDLFLIKESICTEVPTFGRWTDQSRETGKKVILFELKEENDFKLNPKEYCDFVLKSGAEVAVVCNPNNPSGALLSHHEVVEILDRLKSLKLIIVDEAFIDFSYPNPRDIPTVSKDATERENVIVVKSLGKSLGLHGMRLGYGIASKAMIKKLNGITPMWNINGIAEALIRDLEENFDSYESARKRQIEDRLYLEKCLKTLPQLKVFPSTTNFVYIKLPANIDGVEFRNRLIRLHGCFVRECGNKVGSSSQFIRVAVRPKRDVDILIKAMKAEL